MTKKDGVSLEIDTTLVKRILLSFIQTEIHHAGFSRAVIGLSGGLDSSLSCLLTTEALGPENVLAVRMPYKTSPSESLEHAQWIIDQCGIQERTISITEIVEPYFKLFPETDRIRRGNFMARARMMVLYDQSADYNGLVVGTGNKTEILLGYTTLYGDSACALNPLGDLYKTQVRQLAADMNVPDAIIQKPPSADLWVGQTDEDELGLTYKEVDRLLILLIDHRYSLEDCVNAGFEPAFVDKVINRIRRSQFKRVLPPIAKLSNRNEGYDFLYQ